jgi:hypothetical protein
MNRTVAARGSIGWAAFWMFLISLLLFWLPGVGSFIAGLVGGRVAGSVGNAVIAALVPAAVIGAAFAIFATALTGFIAIGFLVGATGFVLCAAHVGLLLLGAIIGGLVA